MSESRPYSYNKYATNPKKLKMSELEKYEMAGAMFDFPIIQCVHIDSKDIFFIFKRPFDEPEKHKLGKKVVYDCFIYHNGLYIGNSAVDKIEGYLDKYKKEISSAAEVYLLSAVGDTPRRDIIEIRQLLKDLGLRFEFRGKFPKLSGMEIERYRFVKKFYKKYKRKKSSTDDIHKSWMDWVNKRNESTKFYYSRMAIWRDLKRYEKELNMK